MANEEHLAKLKEGVSAWNAWRSKNPDEVPDLEEADLRQADLSGANLSKANLWKADLRQADLAKAYLSEANLWKADLRQADLTKANLSEALLASVSLAEANMREATLRSTFLAAIDLSKANGLHTCRHYGPSFIDIRTLELSGMLPVEFLRGCGVSDQLIDLLPSLYGKAIEFYSCFISYSRNDQGFAERLHNDLQVDGVRCWFAPEDMKIGDPIRTTVDQAITLRDKLLLILSRESVESDWVEHEVNMAKQEEKRRGQRVVFPIRIDSAVKKVEFGWARRLRQGEKGGRHIGDFTNWENHDEYQRSFQRLLHDLKGKGASESQT
jgi:hypothetical protein